MRTISWVEQSGVVSRARGNHILDRYGWDSFFRDRFTPFLEQGLSAARVIAEVGPLLRVAGEHGERTAELTGRVRHAAQSRAELPVVGDWVALRSDWGAPRASIFAVLPRRTTFARRAAGKEGEAQVVAANVDTVFVVAGLDLDFNVRRIERAVLLVRESGAEPVIVLSKTDLCDDLPARAADVGKAAPGVAIAPVSAREGTGIDTLGPWLRPGKTVVLVGSSGVGKSSIVNRLLGEERQSTRTVREHDHRGKHTTTRRELVVLPAGALLIDTPGIRELGMLGGEDALGEAFADIDDLAAGCAFTDCTHGGEPRCAVRAALESGALDPARFQSYLKLKDEVATSARRSQRPSQRPRRR